MTLRLPALFIATVAAVTLLVPAPASAKPIRVVTYQATVEGEADYVRIDDDAGSQRDEHASWKWRSVFPRIVFRDDEVHVGSSENLGAPVSATLFTAQAQAVAHGDTYNCTADAFSFTEPGRFVQTPYVPGTDPVIKLYTLGGAIPNFDACNAQSIASFDLLGKFVDGRQTYETQFTFPREAIGMGRVIQLVDEEVTDRRCPNNLAGLSTSCRLEFDATITFDEKEDYVVDDGTPVEITEDDIPSPPPPPPAEPTAPSGTPAPHDSGLLDDLVLPIPPRAAKIAPSAASATVPVTCAADCTGTITATAAGGGKARSAAARVLARKPFKAPAGRTTRVTLRFKPAARRAIRRAGGVKLTIKASSAGRAAAQRTVTLRLKGKRS